MDIGDVEIVEGEIYIKTHGSLEYMYLLSKGKTEGSRG